MEIIIEGKQAAIPDNLTIDYTLENPLFTESDEYSLDITLPLAGCPQNLEIFGHINRADMLPRRMALSCELRAPGFYRRGAAAITEISEKEVKIQFLQGRSAQNFDTTLDDIFINELNLGQPSDFGADASSPATAWNPAITGGVCVALPWVNDSDGESTSGTIHNFALPAASGSGFGWERDPDIPGTETHTWQPYLLHVIRAVCAAIDYSADISELEAREEYRYLLICNTLPQSWMLPGFADVLPHWSVAEFFDRLGQFLMGHFAIDSAARTVSFSFHTSAFTGAGTVHITDVVDEHSAEVSRDREENRFLGGRILSYSDNGGPMWKYQCCDWYIDARREKAVRYERLEDLLRDTAKYARVRQFHRGDTPDPQSLFYAADFDTYFALYCTGKECVGESGGIFNRKIYDYLFRLMPLNAFGARNYGDTHAEEMELDIVPVPVADTDAAHGLCMFLKPGTMDSIDDTDSIEPTLDGDIESRLKERDKIIPQSWPICTIRAGEQEQKNEFYDTLYIGWWDGAPYSDKRQPHPYTEPLEITEDFRPFLPHCANMRLNDASRDPLAALPRVSPDVLRHFSFLATEVPDPMATFYIRGQRYLCEKLTLSITERGIPSLIKGDFRPFAE